MKRFHYYFLFLLTLTIGHTVFGAETTPMTYTPLVGVPGLEAGKVFSTEQYVNVLYYLSISVAGLLAVVQIIYGGVEWTFSDAFTEKSSAKTRIQGALLGLLIILSAVLILNTVNPNLTVLNIFGNAPVTDGVGDTNPSVADTRSSCQKYYNSKACCDERGGNYIRSNINGDSCSMGETTSLPSAAGETTEQQRTFCLNTPGMSWDGSVCRSTSGKQVAFPPGYTDDDGKDDYDRQIFCFDALKGDYNPDNNTCTVNQ